MASAALLALAGCGGAKQALVPIGAGLDGPRGAQATVYARGLTHVSAFAFDSRGRLWATASGASTHAGDGVFLVTAGKVVRIATLRGPLGLVWVGPRLYVSSLGLVTAFSSFDGKRFATRRTVLAGPPGAGENNNIVLAPDGELVLGFSAPCDHCTRPGGIVSFRPGPGGLRSYARRIRAPFGLAFHKGLLYATLNQRDDLGAKTPGDVLVRVLRGDDRRFPGCYDQGGEACKGVSKPVAVLDPHAAAGGIAFLGGDAIVAEWNKAKVLRVELGSGRVTPFLAGMRNPLPLARAPDGSLLAGDWGTGRIYRVVLP